MLASSHAFCACHWSGEFGPADEISSLWVGREVLEELLTAGSAPFAFNQQAAEMVDTRLEFVREGTLDIAVDGEATSLPVVIARAEQATFWIHNDPDDPLVLQVRGLWSSTVTSIVQRADDHIGTMLEIYGRRLHYLDRGEGDPVFVLHGGPGMEFDYFLPHLDGLEAHARLIYIDQPGHGLSERHPPGERYTMNRAVAAIEELRRQLDLDKITLLGHSYGGFLAQLYAVRYPNRVARLILVDTTATWEWVLEANINIRRRGTPKQANPPPGLSDDERLRIVFPLYFYPEDKALSEAFMDRVILSPGPWRQLTRSRQFRDFDLRAPLANLDVPALILVGAEDIITTPRQGRLLEAALSGSRLHIFPETGHNPFVEETAAFTAIVAEFLAETAAATAP